MARPAAAAAPPRAAEGIESSGAVPEKTPMAAMLRKTTAAIGLTGTRNAAPVCPVGRGTEKPARVNAAGASTPTGFWPDQLSVVR